MRQESVGRAVVLWRSLWLVVAAGRTKKSDFWRVISQALEAWEQLVVVVELVQCLHPSSSSSLEIAKRGSSDGDLFCPLFIYFALELLLLLI